MLISCIACHRDQKTISSAMERAKLAGLTKFSESHSSVPYYEQKTLTPLWEKSAQSVKVPDFSLYSQSGSLVNQKIFSGKTSLVFFFFTSCSGFCPTLVRSLKKVEEKLIQFPDVQYVGLSVDPERDRPQVLAAYLRRNGVSARNWTLLTGNKDAIYSLAHKTFAAEAFALPKSKGQIAHTERFYVLDSNGFLRGVIQGTRLDAPDEAFSLISKLSHSHL